jgi:hypothetical protein
MSFSFCSLSDWAAWEATRMAGSAERSPVDLLLLRRGDEDRWCWEPANIARFSSCLGSDAHLQTPSKTVA